MATTAVKHTAVVRMERPETFRCVSCGHTAAVMVKGSGHGSAHASLVMGSEEAAKIEAQKRAETAALADIKANVGRVPCPACGKRDPAWVRRFYQDHGIRIGGMVLAAGFVTFVILSQISISAFLGGWLVVSAIAVGLYNWVVDLTFEWNRASLAVQFPTGGAPGKQG